MGWIFTREVNSRVRVTLGSRSRRASIAFNAVCALLALIPFDQSGQDD